MYYRPFGQKLKSVVRTLSVAGAVVALWSGGAIAADSTASTDTLQEIVITASKRSSTVQDTPISVTAVSAEEIADRGITSFVQLAQSIPGISMRTSGSGQTEFEMRGLQSSGGSSSTVGFYLDETPLSSPASAQNGKVVIDPNLYDLSRVEVLRGPQGTLYGSGSMGGTVKLVPHAPELGVFDASGETVVSNTSSGGSINTAQNGMVNLPLGDTMAIRAVGSLSQTSGWVQRIVIADGQFPREYINGGGVLTRGDVAAAPVVGDYQGSNSSTVQSARLSMLWNPSDRLSIEALLMYQDSNQAGPSATDTSGIYPTASGPEAHYEPYDIPEPYYDRFTLGSVKLAYQFDGFSVTSATGNWNRNSLISQDATEENSTANAGLGGPGNVPALGNGPGLVGYDVSQGGLGPNSPATYERDYTHQISEELRAASTGDSAFQWLGGFFYSKLDTTWGMDSVQPEALPSTLLATFGTDNNSVFNALEPATISQNAFFGEASYKFTPELKATVGLRRFSYTTTQTDNEGGAELGPDRLIGTFSTSQSGVTPKFDLSYEPNRDLMLYATAAKGYRPGGVNQFLPTSLVPGTFANVIESVLQAKFNTTGFLASPQTFAADSVWNYELGEKAEFLDHRMTLNADIYYENWSNPQLLTNAAGFGYTVNGSNAHIYGTEVEFKALLTSELTFGANLSYDHATFLDNNAASGYLAGMSVPDTPKVTSGQTLTYKHPLTSDMSIVGVLDNYYVGNRIDIPYGLGLSIYHDTTQDAIVHLASYDLTNLRVGVEKSKWNASLFVNNVLNKKVLLDPQPQIDIALSSYQRYTVNQPLTAGVDLNYKFGGP
jgi:iron complex outermembrane recepter protein